jgi:plasmid stabilization system protein ParE
MLEASHWYATHAEVLARRFVGEVDAVVTRIADNPLQFPPRAERRAPSEASPIPLCFVFRVVDETVFVIACFHARRDPQRWHGRV